MFMLKFFISNFKSTLCVTLLKAKILAKTIETSIGIKNICCKKKNYNAFGK